MPEKFFDATAGVKGQEFRAEYDTLTAFKLEQDARLAAVPESADKYEILLPSDFKAPDGIEFKLDADDPVMPLVRDYAKANNLSQPEFSKLLGLYAQNRIAETQHYKGLEAKEIEKLGASGPARSDAVKAWFTARVGEEAAKVITDRPVIAAEVEAYEKLMQAFGNVVPFSQQHREQQQSGLTEEQYNAMTPLERRSHTLKTSNGR